MAANRRQFISWLGAAGASGLIGGWPGSAAFAQVPDLSGVTLNISTYKTAYTQFMEAAGQADTPYKVNSVFVTFDVALRSISAGDIDLGVNFTDIPLTIWGHNLGGARLVAVADNVIVSKMLAIIVPPGSTITSSDQLKGRRVGYLKASNQHYFLLKLLEQNRLTFDDIVPVALPRDMGPPAFLSGQLDAWITQGPDTIIAQQRFGGRLLATAEQGYAGNSVVCANLAALNDPRKYAAIADYLQRADRTLRWIKANPEVWAQKSHELTGIEEQVYREQVREEAGHDSRLYAASPVFINEQQQAADFLQSKGVIRQKIDVKPLWDARLAGVLDVRRE
jgi:sulfonate transport system substrate-binding protein